MTTTITTNHRRLAPQMWLDLPERFRMGEGNGYVDVFDGEEDAYTERFIGAYGTYWDLLSDFQNIAKRSAVAESLHRHCVDDDSPLLQWDAIATVGAFAGVVIRYVEDDKVVAGWVKL